jgi:hypothetical protein
MFIRRRDVTVRTVINTEDRGNELVVNNQVDIIQGVALQLAVKNKDKKYRGTLIAGSKCLNLGIETGGRMTTDLLKLLDYFALAKANSTLGSLAEDSDRLERAKHTMLRA